MATTRLTGAADRPFPARRAFVLQLRAEANVTGGELTGRVEHLASGRVAHFDSLAELLRFLATVTEPEDSPL